MNILANYRSLLPFLNTALDEIESPENSATKKPLLVF